MTWIDIQTLEQEEDGRFSRASKRKETVNTVASVYSVWDPDFEDPTTSRIRGAVFLITWLLCILCFTGGVFIPLVRLTVSCSVLSNPGMEYVFSKSLLDVIKSKWDAKQEGAAVCIVVFSIILPVFEFLGTAVIILDNFFAKGWEWQGCMTRGQRNTIVGSMCMMCSYHSVLCFCCILFLAFFSSEATDASEGAGFYFYCSFCLVSIFMFQAMEMLKEPPSVDDDAFAARPSTASFVASQPLRLSSGEQILASIFPELPGMQRVVNAVDARQVCLLSAMFIILVVVSFDQPLFAMHVVVEGLTLERKELTLRQLIEGLWEVGSLVVYTSLMAFVFVIPIVYCSCLLLAALLQIPCFSDGRCLCDAASERVRRRIFDFPLWISGLLRPWAMTDVFALSLFLYVLSAQHKYVITDLPDGFLQLPSLFPAQERKQKAIRLYLLNGNNIFVGAGIAMFFLRWFWHQKFLTPEEAAECRTLSHNSDYTQRSRASTEMNSQAGHPSRKSLTYIEVSTRSGTEDKDDGHDQFVCKEVKLPASRTHVIEPMMAGDAGNPRESDLMPDGAPDFTREMSLTESPLVRAPSRWKVYVCLLSWGAACSLMYVMPYPFSKFRLSHANMQLDAALPEINDIISNHVPASLGSCDRSTQVPLPCREQGMLYQQMQDTKRISILWVGGLNTISINNVSMQEYEARSAVHKQKSRFPTWLEEKHPDAEEASASDNNPKSNGKKTFVLVVAGEFEILRLFLRVEICDDAAGDGCKLLVATNSSCCEDHRAFEIEIEMSCGKDKVPALGIRKFHLDPLVIDAQTSVMVDVEERLDVALPERDITEQVKSTVSPVLHRYLTEKDFLKWDSGRLTIQQLLGRVLHLSARDHLFQC